MITSIQDAQGKNLTIYSNDLAGSLNLTTAFYYCSRSIPVVAPIYIVGVKAVGGKHWLPCIFLFFITHKRTSLLCIEELER